MIKRVAVWGPVRVSTRRREEGLDVSQTWGKLFRQKQGIHSFSSFSSPRFSQLTLVDYLGW